MFAIHCLSYLLHFGAPVNKIIPLLHHCSGMYWISLNVQWPICWILLYYYNKHPLAMGWVRWLYLTETEWKLWIFAANLLKYFPHPFICRCPGWVTGLVSTIHVMYVQGELSGVRGGGGSSLCYQAKNLRDATLQLNISIASCQIHLQGGGNV